MSKRILVVDDDNNIRRLVTFALTEDSPYTVHDVSSAEAALLHVSRYPVDLLFTDLRMPGMDGVELVRRVRELGLSFPVIIFTITPTDIQPQEAQQLNITCTLEKPLSPEQVRSAVDVLLDPNRTRPPQIGDLPQAPGQPRPRTKPLPSLKKPATSMASGPLAQRIAQNQQSQARPAAPAPPASGIAMRVNSGTGTLNRNYSTRQLETMRLALKDLVLSPDVHAAIVADTSGMVLTHWSRERDINVTMVAALAAGNSMALAEIGRNMGQRQPGQIVFQEGVDKSIVIAQMENLLLVLAIGANASLGWARIAALRACEDVLRIAHGG
ncbi:MAG: response regulator [Chloroflexaceae bacterium]|jgi:CheY-like chemotaxis protein/predicted regulator of Ras-like GTPase activity (Roadblock/LC7/MglB family)|nr:response regulator [Chloroflexaceae bacterium]